MSIVWIARHLNSMALFSSSKNQIEPFILKETKSFSNTSEAWTFKIILSLPNELSSSSNSLKFQRRRWSRSQRPNKQTKHSICKSQIYQPIYLKIKASIIIIIYFEWVEMFTWNDSPILCNRMWFMVYLNIRVACDIVWQTPTNTPTKKNVSK